MKYLIIGLGNIGPTYDLTRHNIGFQIVDQLAADHQVTFQLGRLALITSLRHKGRTIYLIKPTTYMNESGKAVQYWMGQLKIPLANTLTIVDDLALPVGKLRLRPKGSSAGHNGLHSIETSLKTQEYPRLRFGIGNNFSKGQQSNYVLGCFKAQELALIAEPIQQAAALILSFCTAGMTETMNRFNVEANASLS
eukprot:gene62-88_t